MPKINILPRLLYEQSKVIFIHETYLRADEEAVLPGVAAIVTTSPPNEQKPGEVFFGCVGSDTSGVLTGTVPV